MSPEAMDQLVERHFEAELSGDIDALVDGLADGVEHDTAGWPEGPLHGRDAVRVFYSELFKNLRFESYETVRRLHGPSHVIEDGLLTTTAIGSPFGIEGRDRTVAFRMLQVFEFAGGEIARENAWMDAMAIMRQLA